MLSQWWGARARLQAGRKVWDALLRVGGDHGHAVAGRHEESPAQDHVAVAVAVAGGAQVGGRLCPLALHKLVRVGQVGVRVPAAKVLQRRPVAVRRARRASAPPERAPCGRRALPYYRMQRKPARTYLTCCAPR